MFWYALLRVLYSFAIILMEKRELVALIVFLVSCDCSCSCSVSLFCGTMGWSALYDCGIS